MAIEFEKVDWSKELQTLVAQADSDDDKKAAFAFANAIHPYLDNPALLRTLLGKIMQSPTESLALIASEKEFDSLEEVQKKVGDSVSVVKI